MVGAQPVEELRTGPVRGRGQGQQEGGRLRTCHLKGNEGFNEDSKFDIKKN